MKKWAFLFLLLLLIGGYIAFKSDAIEVKHRSLRDNQSTIEVTRDQIYKGNLILVNKKYAVHTAGIKDDITKLANHKDIYREYSYLDNKIQISQSLLDQFLTMIHAAKKEKITHFSITSSFRGETEQEQLYQKKGSDYALPAGYSEHNVGFSVDIGSTQTEMNQSAEGKWLKENAWKYGFILRYPVDKVSITGIQFEPWHFRYVGFPHSKIMQEKNLTLEEYIDYLKEKKTITSKIDDQSYQISYYPITSSTSIHIPANHRYEISGDNVDGVILTTLP